MTGQISRDKVVIYLTICVVGVLLVSVIESGILHPESPNPLKRFNGFFRAF